MIEHKGNLSVVSHRGISHRYTSHPVIGRTESTNQNKSGDFKTYPNGAAICKRYAFTCIRDIFFLQK